jgi:hypothetical protein
LGRSLGIVAVVVDVIGSGGCGDVVGVDGCGGYGDGVVEVVMDVL